MKPARSSPLLALLGAGALVAAAGCGSSSSSASSGAGATTATGASTGATTSGTTSTRRSGTTPAAASIKVTADPDGQLAFVQKSLTAQAGEDTFVFTNPAVLPHNFAIKGNGVNLGPTATISQGKTARLKVSLKPGTYEYYCAIPGHEQAGMKGTLTVS